MPALRIRSLALVAVLVTAAIALSGCSIAEGIIQQQTGVDVNLPGMAVPEDFPAEVPLTAGDVELAGVVGEGAARVWNVTIATAADANPAATIAAELEAAGFTADVDLGEVTDQGGVLSYSSGDRQVVVLVGQNQGVWTANYTVSTKAAG